ncbi:VOC family protein [Pseudonocardia sulfidoxydans]|uniref:VOC family protein n=1 Tax=Pseudonocardia sulfidoxydans TaxID=54011 RepID=UPI001649A2A8|nr:VOC family protein [Pseudonocardia sulfidoxydans]
MSVAVRDLDAAVESYRALGLEPVGGVKQSPRGLGLRWVELGRPDGQCLLELMSPVSDSAPLARFLDRHGEGVYQVRLGTSSLPQTLATLSGRGVRVVRDETPTGARPLGWVHPASTHGVLVEVVEEEEQ